MTNDFFNNKLFDTYVNFENGINITYNNIGKICFALFSRNGNNYIIEDVLGNNITSQFDSFSIQSHDILLFASKNIYTNSTINIKIKSNDIVNTNIFSNIFNNKFK